jgi:hypothetical protein
MKRRAELSGIKLWSFVKIMKFYLPSSSPVLLIAQLFAVGSFSGTDLMSSSP